MVFTQCVCVYRYEYSYLRMASCEGKVLYSEYIVVYPLYIVDFLCAIDSRDNF